MTDSQNFQTCRFCHKMVWGDDLSRMVKYGVRHYAHHACYLDAGKRLEDLHDWQVARFPYFLLKQRGLLEYALAASKRVQPDPIMDALEAKIGRRM